MASAQVLPNSATSSRKQGHLEAGKKRLEEFRKKKAEGRAKKVVSTGQLQSADVDQSEKFSQNYEHARDSTETRDNSTGWAHEGKGINSSGSTVIGSANDTHATSALVNSDSTLYGEVQDTSKDEASILYDSSALSEPVNNYYGRWRENSELSHTEVSNFEPNASISEDGLNVSDSVGTERNDSYSSFHFDSQSRESRNSSKIMSTLPERSGDALANNRSGYPSTSGTVNGSNGETADGVEYGSAFGGRTIMSSNSHQISVGSAPWHVPEPSSTSLSLPIKSSSNQESLPLNDPGTTTGRSRPSFLDSLGLPRISSTPHKPYYDPPNPNPPTSSTKQLFSDVNYLEQFQNSRTPNFANEKELYMNSSVSSNDSQPQKPGASDHLHWDQDLKTKKKDEDFSALEQYIEDLTQEKFSLQRALEASRSLAESLAAENSSLTETYNQQGQVINQLKSDVERLQVEIKAQLIALDSFKLDYTNAQLECNAADERAKILASEVISLEEKALRLRSSELKLEKQMENMNSEITSYKRKVSILEKERQDFQSTIDALQEEKKLLQSKLRKASTNAKPGDSLKTPSIKRDASTSTEDLGVEHLDLVHGETSNQETMLQNALEDITPSVALSSNSSSFSVLSEDRRIHLPDISGVIPNDQIRMIGNINSLISEIALEKEELMQALVVESANSSKLKDLNKDLSKKLEAQTQRLELLTAQRMAHENALAKPTDIHRMHDTPVYADEGDEVVDRVLGWIMKLFPGGPSKGRTRKHL